MGVCVGSVALGGFDTEKSLSEGFFGDAHNGTSFAHFSKGIEGAIQSARRCVMIPIQHEPTRADYLTAIRDYVCSRCVERPAGGPPCLPLGKVCGVELHLPELIDAIHRCNSPYIGPYLAETHETICERCAYHGGDQCPCPMDTLALLLVEAVEEVDRQFAARNFERELEETGGGD